MVFLDPDYSQDSRPPGDDTPVPVWSSSQVEQQQELRDRNSQVMKPDLNTSLSISGEISPLPFSMPKLERKLKDSQRGSPGLAVQTRPNLSLSLASKQARPCSLHTSTPTRSANIRLALQTSGKSGWLG